MPEKITSFFIFEILGKPPEHLKETLSEFVNKLEENKGIRITNKKIHEPKLIEGDAKELYTTFSEVEMEIDNLGLLFALILNKLPSTVEVIRPAEIKIDNFDLSPLLTELSMKLHKYDEVAKTLIVENSNFLNKIRELENKIKILGNERVNVTIGAGKNEEKKILKSGKIKRGQKRKKGG